MELAAVAKRVSNVQQFAFADGAEWSLSGIWRSSATGGGGGGLDRWGVGGGSTVYNIIITAVGSKT